MHLRSATPIRVLDNRDLPEALAILDRDPVMNVFVSSRVRLTGLDPDHLGAEIWGYSTHGRLESLCYSGANLVPVETTPEAVEAFADRARWQGRRCSSIVGPADAVSRLWDLLRPHWSVPRVVRNSQPVMATSSVPPVTPDPAVRHVRDHEFDILLPACVAMFTEEVGVSPQADDGGVLYRARVGELIRTGRAFARIENGAVVFKAEVGAVTPQVCQVQGVWVNPRMRGQRISEHGMATVVREALTSIAPTVSLYVNEYNVAARAAYRRVGFEDVGTFMSVLF
jgi:uncharacterized protein